MYLSGNMSMRYLQEEIKGYTVVVNRRSFPLSWCSCRYDGTCKHLTGVVYAAVEQEEKGGAADKDESKIRSLLLRLSRGSIGNGGHG